MQRGKSISHGKSNVDGKYAANQGINLNNVLLTQLSGEAT